MRSGHHAQFYCLVIRIIYISGLCALALNQNVQNTRRDVFRSTAAAILTSSAGGILLKNEAANAQTLTSPSPVSNGAYLTPDYYNTPVTAASKGRFYFPTLTPPFQNRATYRTNRGRNAWGLEQLLTFSNVTATITTNVIRLESGGLWVHSPQWPTGEFCALLEELGSVEHVVLPCNAFEHAAPMKAFCKRYPRASVWVSPGQYGPFGSCGRSLAEPCTLGYRVDGILGNSRGDGDALTAPPPWADEFEYTTLYVSLPENAGPVSEVAFLHKPTKTLVATDAVVYIPDSPSPLFSTYFDADTIREPEFWPKTVLQSVFLPLRKDGGKYPGYEAIRGRVLRAPILRGFNDARAPELTKRWIDTVGQWDFDRVITSHFASPIGVSSPQTVTSAFAFLNADNAIRDNLPPIACQDWELLDGLNDFIAANKIGAPATFNYRQDCK